MKRFLLITAILIFFIPCVSLAGIEKDSSSGSTTAAGTSFDNTAAALPDNPDNVQDAIDKLAEGGATDAFTVKIDSAATAGYIGAGADGVLRAGTGIAKTDGGDYVTLTLSFLGIENLTDPDADRLMYWNDTGGAFGWLDYSGWDTNAADDFDGAYSSLTGVPTIPTVSDIAYDATTWDGNTDAATKNAIRDKIETLSGGHDAVTLDANAEALLSLTGQEFGLDTQTANYIFAGPVSGGAATPLFRAMVAADVPSLDASKITTGVFGNDRINWAAPGAIGGTTPAAITGTTITASSFVSSAADGDHYTNIGNTNDYDETKSDGDMWYNRTSDLLKIYDGAEDDIIITDDAFSGNTETGIDVTPQSDGTVDFVVDADLQTLAAPTAWRLFYSNGTSVITELALGADGTYLKSNGASAAPTFSTPSGSGDVTGPATNTNNYIPQWDGADSKALKDGLAAPTGAIVGTTDTQTLTNKTISTGSVVPVTIGIACSDETTDLTTGTAKTTFRMPHAMTLTAVRANVNTAPVGSTIIVDINEAGSTIMTTNKLSIDASEETSTTAETSAGITDSSLADDAEMTIDIDQIGSSTAGKGLKVWLIGTRTL